MFRCNLKPNLIEMTIHHGIKLESFIQIIENSIKIVKLRLAQTEFQV